MTFYKALSRGASATVHLCLRVRHVVFASYIHRIFLVLVSIVAFGASPACAQNGCNGRSFASLRLPSGEIVFAGDFTECGGVSFNRIVRYNPDRNRWLPLGERGRGVNDAVYALAWFQDTLIVGGGFTRVGDKQANSLARWNPNTGQWSAFRSGDGQFNGTSSAPPNLVIALEADQSTLYVGGQFGEMVGLPTPDKLVKFENNQFATVGSLGPVNAVFALKMFQGQLHLGADGLQQFNHLARFDGVQWQPLAFGVNGAIRRFTEYQNQLIVVGIFNRDCAALPPASCVGAQSRATGNVIAWNGATLELVNGYQNAGSLHSSGLSGAFGGADNLYLGGLITGATDALGTRSFYGMAQSLAPGAANWHVPGTVAGSAVGGLFGICGNGSINAGYASTLIESDGVLYVGGDFQGVGAPVEDDFKPLSNCPVDQPLGLKVRNFARWDGQQWSSIDGRPDDEFLFGDGLE